METIEQLNNRKEILSIIIELEENSDTETSVSTEDISDPEPKKKNRLILLSIIVSFSRILLIAVLSIIGIIIMSNNYVEEITIYADVHEKDLTPIGSARIDIIGFDTTIFTESSGQKLINLKNVRRSILEFKVSKYGYDTLYDTMKVRSSIKDFTLIRK